MDYAEKWGKDEDEAIRLALIDLKLTIDEVDVIVLEESSKGFFGIGSKLAKVRVQKKATAKAEQKPAKEVVKETPITKVQSNSNKEITKKEFVKKEKKENKEVKEVKENKNSVRQPDNMENIKTERPNDLTPVESSPALDFLKDNETACASFP